MIVVLNWLRIHKMRARAMEGGVSLAWGERNHGEEAATVRDPSRSTEK